MQKMGEIVAARERSIQIIQKEFSLGPITAVG